MAKKQLSQAAQWDHEFVWHPFTQMQDWLAQEPVVIERGEGVYLIDENGKKYYDGVSSLWVNIHGHNHPVLNQALKEQVDKIAHSTLLGLVSPPSAQLCKELVELAPEGLNKVFLSDDGSTAIEVAIKMDITTKGVADVPWAGNPTPRVAEVYGGMMNAIGLQNPGIDLFCERDIPYLQKYDTKIIVNVCGHAPEEYFRVVERLADEPIDMMEINISCPNVNAGFLAFGQDAKNVEKLTADIKKIAKQPIIMKLTPNVTDITEIAKAAEAGGADAVSLINTLTGMKIDINRKTFALANKTGGVSGPIVKPIAVRMVYQVGCFGRMTRNWNPDTCYV